MELTDLDKCVKWLSGDSLAKLRARLPKGRWVYCGSEKYRDATCHFFKSPRPNSDGRRKRITLEDHPVVIALPYSDLEHRPMVDYGAK
jgi:hypothetical protein